MKKRALITGITGQDGSYLTEFLLEKNYTVWGLIRRSSNFNTSRIDHLLNNKNLFLKYYDLTDSCNIVNIINEIKNSYKNIKVLEIYNLAAMSHVKVSFEMPEYTANVDGIGVLRILESIKNSGISDKIKFYQASTSELYGLVQEIPQKETTPFYPRSPYAIAKLYAYWITVNYRESYGMYACNGILFNHESPRRGETFVTQKIVQALCRIKNKKQKTLYLGNLNSKRDWGHAKDYVEAMWRMLQQKKPIDLVISTGKQTTVKNFVNKVSKKLEMKILWRGKGINERGIDQNGRTIVACDKSYYRPLEVNSLLGDSRKARKILNWKPKFNLDSLISEMVNLEMNRFN